MDKPLQRFETLLSIFEIFCKESLFPTLSSFSALQFVSLTKLEVCSLYFGHLQYSVCALYFKVWVIIILSTFWNMAFWHNCKLHSAQCNGGWIDFNAELTKNFCLCKLWREFTKSRGIKKSRNPTISESLPQYQRHSS